MTSSLNSTKNCSDNSLFSLKSKVILVTGALGQLGSIYSDAILKAGGTVIAIDLNDVASISTLAHAENVNYHYFQADILDRSRLQEIAKTILNEFGKLDGLVNNAALDSPPDAPLSETGPFEDYPEESFDKVMDVNVKGTLLCCQTFGKAMTEHGNGSIVNIGSIYGELSPNQNIYDFRRKNGDAFYKPVAYSTSKSALYNLTRYIATYWAKQGVRANILTLAGLFNHQPDEFLEAYLPLVPMGRMAEAQDYIGPLIFLLSDASRYMTGSTLTVDGGWKAW